jgi:hypothetical protein
VAKADLVKADLVVALVKGEVVVVVIGSNNDLEKALLLCYDFRTKMCQVGAI